MYVCVSVCVYAYLVFYEIGVWLEPNISRAWRLSELISNLRHWFRIIGVSHSVMMQMLYQLGFNADFVMVTFHFKKKKKNYN